ncbi:MAG: hypothetical protein A3C35_03900 [Omnitrophica bacterium RIFCSPHIGHO2_02_FULL_46_11]|nr:MAG: hypothetical protein A3A81_07045 [Omnitrophica bacterium RIFCSPLOWO2_01_FULL_45_10b]OGW86010.1 MAG: hypothetical protein A3C35_03900 [Omnitrophica bacterium RIFCSPHIGHO2_02_FULL_46_11]
MTQPQEVERLIQRAIPDAEVHVDDMTGTGDHFEILVASSVFRGKMLIDQHRIVQKALQAAFDDGRIHAVQIKTRLPNEGKANHSQTDDFHVIG